MCFAYHSRVPPSNLRNFERENGRHVIVIVKMLLEGYDHPEISSGHSNQHQIHAQVCTVCWTSGASAQSRPARFLRSSWAIVHSKGISTDWTSSLVMMRLSKRPLNRMKRTIWNKTRCKASLVSNTKACSFFISSFTLKCSCHVVVTSVDELSGVTVIYSGGKVCPCFRAPTQTKASSSKGVSSTLTAKYGA